MSDKQETMTMPVADWLVDLGVDFAALSDRSGVDLTEMVGAFVGSMIATGGLDKDLVAYWRDRNEESILFARERMKDKAEEAL